MSIEEKFLCATLDKNLTFKTHLDSLSKGQLETSCTSANINVHGYRQNNTYDKYVCHVIVQLLPSDFDVL